MTSDERETVLGYLAVAYDFVIAAKHVVGDEEPSSDLVLIIAQIQEVGRYLMSA